MSATTQTAFAVLGVEPDEVPQTPEQDARAAQWARLTAAGKALCPDFDGFVMLQIPGNPVGKSRPRFSRTGHAYTDATTREREEYTASHMREAAREPNDGNLVIVCAFYRSTYQRIDVDNMLKHVCDSANGVLWRDDSQVKAIAGFIDYDKESPRTLVMLGRTSLGMTRPSERDRKCPVCGVAFRTFYQQTRCCSRACAAKRGGATNREQRKCFTCGAAFTERRAGQRYCSRKCSRTDPNRNKKVREQAVCRHCGKPVSRPEYTRCRGCFNGTTAFPAAAENTLAGLKALGKPKARPRLVSSRKDFR